MYLCVNHITCNWILTEHKVPFFHPKAHKQKHYPIIGQFITSFGIATKLDKRTARFYAGEPQIQYRLLIFKNTGPIMQYLSSRLLCPVPQTSLKVCNLFSKWEAD